MKSSVFVAVTVLAGMLTGCSGVRDFRDQTDPTRRTTKSLSPQAVPKPDGDFASACAVVATSRPLPNGASFEAEIEGSCFVRDGGKGYWPMTAFINFGDVSNSPRPTKCRISRSNGELKIELLGGNSTVIVTKVLSLIEVLGNGSVIVRHEEKKIHRGEDSTFRYTECQDFYLSPRGELVVQAHASGTQRGLLIVTVPWESDAVWIFPPTS